MRAYPGETSPTDSDTRWGDEETDIVVHGLHSDTYGDGRISHVRFIEHPHLDLLRRDQDIAQALDSQGDLTLSLAGPKHRFWIPEEVLMISCLACVARSDLA